MMRIERFGGVDLFYDRSHPDDYGVRGVPMRPLVEARFAARCEEVFDRLVGELDAGRVGRVSAIFCGGISRNPTLGAQSFHYQNRAFDLDALVFDNAPTWTAKSFPEKPHLYLGIEATIRMSFGTVLGYVYNADHRDHIHFDDGTAVGFNTYAKSRVEFLQNCCRYLFDRDLGVDGVYGPLTRGVADGVRRELNIGPLTSRDSWHDFLHAVMDEAFRRAAFRLEPTV
jgi:hypothetical protein